jgi:hypothetical protein
MINKRVNRLLLPYKLGEFCFTHLIYVFLDYPIAMLKNFDLPSSVDFLLMWHENVTCHISKSVLSRQQKVNRKG